MREDIFKSFDGLKLNPVIKHLRGIGKGELVTVGCFYVDLEAGGVCLSVTFHVAKQNELEYDAISRRYFQLQRRRVPGRRERFCIDT